MTKRDLTVNSLSRYSKESPGLVLEEHGHCEVPAGCGGVVLRWINSNRAIPVSLWLFANDRCIPYLDGSMQESGRPLIAFGEHVLGFHVAPAEVSSLFFMFAAVYDEDSMVHTEVSRKTGKKLSVLSADDNSWKYTTTEPLDDAWSRPGFDDSGWSAMRSVDLPPPAQEDRNYYRYQKLREFGACALTVADCAGPVWIRKAFLLS